MNDGIEFDCLGEFGAMLLALPFVGLVVGGILASIFGDEFHRFMALINREILQDKERMRILIGFGIIMAIFVVPFQGSTVAKNLLDFLTSLMQR